MTILSNLTRAAVAVALTPVAAVADVLTLPSSAYNDRAPFGRVAGLVRSAGQCVKQATKPVGR